jgi:4-diphosphocytidyl-2-C-methyl-D-erythritol kinase
VGRPRSDGLHPVCSLFASIALADELVARVTAGASEDVVRCPGVQGENLAAQAVRAFREEAAVPPLEIEIDKRIPVAAGLGGGSADAAAALRAANTLAGAPLDQAALCRIAARLGSDVPSQVEAAHAVVSGAGERVQPVRLPPLHLVLMAGDRGLTSAEAYAELDRLGRWSDRLDPSLLGRLASRAPEELAQALHNDLQPAVLSLRPEVEAVLRALSRAGALGVAVSGSGPTVFGIFADPEDARRAAAGMPGALATRTRRV